MNARLGTDLASKIDGKAAWILRTLRKEAAAASEDIGTDIGKVSELLLDP